MKHNMVLFANVTACLQAIWSYFTSIYYYPISETFTSHLKKLKLSLFSGIFSEVKNI